MIKRAEKMKKHAIKQARKRLFANIQSRADDGYRSIDVGASFVTAETEMILLKKGYKVAVTNVLSLRTVRIRW